jgi:Ribonuclease G/E
VVLLDGRPEHLIIERDFEAARARLGEVRCGRIVRVAPGFAAAFVDLGEGLEAWLKTAGFPPVEGAAVELEITAEARGGKLAQAAYRGPATGTPGLLSPAPPLEAVLQRLAPGPLTDGRVAREAADAAQDLALARSVAIGQGVTLTIEPTRALVAIDVDLGEASRPRGAAAAANLHAVREAARLLRLKGLGGLAYIDLAGGGVGQGVLDAAEAAFAEDGPAARVRPIQGLGALAVTRPHGRTPVAERLLDGSGQPTPETRALVAARAMADAATADPGAQVVARASAALAERLAPLAELMGPRFAVEPAIEIGRPDPDIIAR